MDLIVAAENATFQDPVVLMAIGGVEYHGHAWELGARRAKAAAESANALEKDRAEALQEAETQAAANREKAATPPNRTARIENLGFGCAQKTHKRCG